MTKTIRSRCRINSASLFLFLFCVSACDRSDQAYIDQRIDGNPYAAVDWANDLRLKAQHHDHLANRPELIRAYDEAGYDVLSLMDYTGAPNLPYALRTRMWPPENWVPNWVSSSLTHVKFFIPNGEEVGLGWRHVTSPFMSKYIEVQYPEAFERVNEIGMPPSVPPDSFFDPDTEYTDLASMLSLIRKNGGVPCVAHPWNYGYDGIKDLPCVEIFSAYAEALRFLGRKAFVDVDRNAKLIASWDRALQLDQRIRGIAVNDHFGPRSKEGKVPDNVLDSGKIIILSPEATPEAYRERFLQGAILAIRDTGPVKDQYPRIDSIAVEETSIFIETRGAVRWISNGVVIGEGPLLLYSRFPPDTRYVRAEIAGEDGSVVYTQAFVVRPVLDTDRH